jgi:putative redox protein
MTTGSLTATVDPRTLQVEATTESGFTVAFDRGESGAARRGAGPTEVVLAALAACTSMDVASILAKKRQRVDRYQVVVRGDRAAEHPKVFTRIEIEHHVSGAVEPEALRRSIELSATRYCPVSAMLSRATTLEHRYRLSRGDGEPETAEALVVTTGPDGARIG